MYDLKKNTFTVITLLITRVVELKQHSDRLGYLRKRCQFFNPPESHQQPPARISQSDDRTDRLIDYLAWTR